jgi:hypothetical protein
MRVFVLGQHSARLQFTMRLRGKGRRNGKVYSDTPWHSMDMALRSKSFNQQNKSKDHNTQHQF